MNILRLIKQSIGREKITQRCSTVPAAHGIREDMYEQLLTDPIISGAVDLLILKTVGEGIRLTGGDKALREQLTEMLNGFTLPLTEILREALLAVVYGSAVFEKIFDYRDGRYIIKDLKYKQPSAYTFSVDEYGTMLGVVTKSRELIPPEKLFVFVNKGAAGSGVSSLAPCRPLWRMKRDKMEEYCKYLSLYASPPLIGTLPKDTSAYDRQGFLKDLGAVKSGGTMVVSHGTEINAVSVQNNESLYLNFIDFCNREMITAVLGSNRAVQEARYGSKADSQTSMLLIEDRVKFYRQNLAEAVRDQLLYPVAEANLGREAAAALTPQAEFVPDKTEDIIAYGEMIGRLYSAGYIADSQLEGLDAALRLPPR